jgi:predicted  nucleic acid-binding Zn-ribbon protein
MSTRVELNKILFDKVKYSKTIDTSFKELLPPQTIEEETPLTVEEFFEAYDNLFFEIAKTGLNSHNTLIEKSTEYVGDEQTNAELDALYAEITNLREQLLETQKELNDLRTSQAEEASQIDNNG